MEEMWVLLDDRVPPIDIGQVVALSQNGRMHIIDNPVYLARMMDEAAANGEQCFYTHWMKPELPDNTTNEPPAGSASITELG